MVIANTSVGSRVYARICAANPGSAWTASDFADFGSRDSTDKALQRLVATGKIRRIDRGLYDRPGINQLTGQPAAADYRAVVDAIARRDRTRVLVDGMTAANDLGLSDAVPGRVIVHSDSRLKPLRLGNLVITFRPTAASRLYWAGRPAMRIVQALHWLKPKISDLDDRQRIQQRIASMLSDRKGGAALRKDLKNGLASLPSWMQDFLRDMISGDRLSSAKSSDHKLGGKRRKASAP